MENCIYFFAFYIDIAVDVVDVEVELKQSVLLDTNVTEGSKFFGGCSLLQTRFVLRQVRGREDRRSFLR